MNEPDKPFYEFGPFILDTREKVLLREGKPVPLKPKGYKVLLALVERSGFIVEKDFFMREVWDGSLREESNLPQQVSVLRKTLGEVEGGNGGEKYIETVATRGYKFIATVRAVQSPSENGGRADAIVAQPTAALTTSEPIEEPDSASLILQKHTAIRVVQSANQNALDTGLAQKPAERVAALSSSTTRDSLFSLSARGKLLASANRMQRTGDRDSSW